MDKKPIHIDLQNKYFDKFLKVKSTTGLESFIGMKARYKNWTPALGSLAKDEVYLIGSIQKIYNGDFAFRVYATSYGDTFGRPMKIDEAIILN